MTTPDTTTDPYRAFRDALPPHVRAQLHDTHRVVVLVHQATQQGWDTRALITECTRNLAGHVNVGGLVTYRLEHCAENPPATAPARVSRPFCSAECRDNAGWVLGDQGVIEGRCACRTKREA